MTELKKAPLMRLFRLRVADKRVDDFKQVGHYNLTTSIKTEAGTLAMYTAQDPREKSVTYVVEIYRDEESYEIHANSGQFLIFANFAKEALTDRRVFQLLPQLIIEKAEPLYIERESKTCLQLTEISIKTEKAAVFKAAVTDHLKNSIENESSILAVYAATLFDEPHHWYFIELYQDEAGSKDLHPTRPFETFKKQIASMIEDEKQDSLIGQVLVNQGGLFYESN